MSSQESVEDIIPDTLPTQKEHRNGSDISGSPPKKQKRKRRTQVCVKETVKDDTALVFRYFLLRSQSITEADLEEDLETDAGPEESADESEQMKKTYNKVACRLKEIGDDVNKKYQMPDLNELVGSLLKASVYAKFRETLSNFVESVCDGSDPSRDSLALVFHLVERLAEAAKDAGQGVQEGVELAGRYVNDVYGKWLEENGGWETAV